MSVRPAGLVADRLLNPVSWHSDLYFGDKNNQWKVIYSRDGFPVIIEKNIGKGSIVLSADSYYFSNEALRAEPHPGLLAWITGKNARVVFDEFHFGIQKNPGIADLARKYRLHGFFLGIIVLAVLFVWKNSVYFVPPTDDRTGETSEVVSEKDHRKGLISMLRRNIKTQDILKVCITEWKKSFPDTRNISESKLKEMGETENIILKENSRFAKHDDIIKGYNKICRILSKKEIK
ncbi:MAG: hypothetical protein GY749_40150 [Desulfobacteraceae bacterium]|nr:hypothetical protein [Desulfobacteraceae bacterium]